MTALPVSKQILDYLHGLPGSFRGWWGTQRHWLLVLVPFLVILWEPLRWCMTLWFIRDSQQTYQAFIPLGAIFLGLQRRGDVTRIYLELSQLFPDPQSPQRRGNLLPIVIASILFVVSYLATMPPLAVFAAILTIAGTIYFMYGPFVIRPLFVPLAFLLLMIPLPTSAMLALVGAFSRMAALFAAQSLTGLKTPADIVFDRIILKANNLEIPATPSFSGILLVNSVFCCALFWVLLRRPPAGRSVVLLLSSILIPAAINLSRLVILGRVGAANPVQALQLHRLPLLVPLIVSAALVVLVGWFLGRRRPTRIVWAEPDPS